MFLCIVYLCQLMLDQEIIKLLIASQGKFLQYCLMYVKKFRLKVSNKTCERKKSEYGEKLRFTTIFTVI